MSFDPSCVICSCLCILQSEYFSNVKERIQKKLDVPDKEFEKVITTTEPALVVQPDGHLPGDQVRGLAIFGRD